VDRDIAMAKPMLARIEAALARLASARED